MNRLPPLDALAEFHRSRTLKDVLHYIDGARTEIVEDVTPSGWQSGLKISLIVASNTIDCYVTGRQRRKRWPRQGL